jgi:S1-C subfamily serine protease
MPTPGIPGTSPSVLSAKPETEALISDGISQKRIDAVLGRLPAAERRSRGSHDVAIFREISPSVVLVATNDGLGSGSIVEDGSILTNWHVVRGYNQVGIFYKPTRTGAQPLSADMVLATVVKFDQVRDLALLRPFSLPSSFTKPIALADPNDIQVGADVHAIGHPRGEEWSYTKGIISQIRDNYVWRTEDGVEHRANVIQTQTPINPGNSGGPLLSDDGKLIGVNSFKATGEALNFAVSVSDVRAFLAASSNVVANRPEKCTSKVVFEGRNQTDDAFIRQVSLNCDNFPDLIFVLPDDKKLAMLALFDTKRRKKPDGIVFDPSRSANWKFSFWDANFDDTFPLQGIHKNGELKPVRYVKRCKRKAAKNFRCL